MAARQNNLSGGVKEPHMKPYEWQQPSVDMSVQSMQDNNIILNTSDTGTGKTVVACATAKQLGCKFVIVAPLIVHDAWKRTIEAFGISKQFVGIVNPERLLYKNDFYKKRGHSWNIPTGAIVIWDEVHRGASGYKTQTTQALAMLKAFKVPVMPMSATVADSPLKLRGVGYLLGLHKYEWRDFRDWAHKYGCYYDKRYMKETFVKGVYAQRYMKQIHELISDRMVRIRIEDLKDFPESQLLANLYTLKDKYVKEIHDIYAEMREEVKENPSNILTARLRARQRTELIKVPLLRDLGTEAHEEKHSPVFFVNFRDSAEALHRELEAEGIPTGIIIGQQKEKERTKMKDAFQDNKLQAMVCTQAGGLGIDLHDVKQERPRRSFITPSDNAVHMVQSLGRIRRSGGTDVVQTFVLIAGTVEEKIHASLTQKLSNIETLNDGDLEA